MPTSQARQRANEQNARRSTGPKSDAGKQQSRRNSITHGMTGEGVVLLQEMAAEVDQLTRTLLVEIQPRTALGKAMVHKTAVMIQRFETSVKQERGAIAIHVDAALADFDQSRVQDAADLFDGLAEQPAKTLAQLREFPEGITRLVEAWAELDPCSDAWGPDDWAKLDHLRGLPANPSPDRSRREVGPIIEREIGQLQLAFQRIDFATLGQARQNVADAALFDPSPEACLARRYEAVSNRMLYKAIATLKQAEAGELASISGDGTGYPAEISATLGSFIPATVPPPTPVPIVPNPAPPEPVPSVPTPTPVSDPASERLKERAQRPDPRKLLAQMKKRR